MRLGLAVELAQARGAAGSGIDASGRLINIARDRNPEADLRVGDMCALPWPDSNFDVATSFRGVRATTPHAVSEMARVLAPGGRIGITVWGTSSGRWVPGRSRPSPSQQHRRSRTRRPRSPSAAPVPVRNCWRSSASTVLLLAPDGGP